MEFESYNTHYLSVDSNGIITRGWSDGPCPKKDTEGAIVLNDKGGYQFRLILDGQLTEENPPLFSSEYGIPLYKWDGSQVIRRTEEEIAADVAALPEPPPSEQEQLRADVDFLAAMSGIEL